MYLYRRKSKALPVPEEQRAEAFNQEKPEVAYVTDAGAALQRGHQNSRPPLNAASCAFAMPQQRPWYQSLHGPSQPTMNEPSLKPRHTQ